MDRKHLKCLLWKGLWVLSLLSFIAALLAGVRGLVLGFPNGIWFWNSLILGVLAIPIKLDCSNCSTCGISR